MLPVFGLLQGAEPPAHLSAAFITFAAGAGALSLLTPCVFPMVPITVSYFAARDPHAQGRGLRDVLIFGAGIVATFTALGLAFAALAGAAGLMRFAANPWVNLAIAAVFVALALNLLGLYELRVPQPLVRRLDAASRAPGISRAAATLLMGALFTLTSFTCTAPFIGTLLVTAARGEWRLPLVGMLVYATVFALPFVLLAAVPGLATRLPRSGEWSARVRGAMGFVELAAAVKFISNADLVWGWNLFTHDVVLGTWVALALALAFYLLGAFRLPHEPPTPVSSRNGLPTPGFARGVAALAALALGMWLATGFSGAALGTLEAFLPPPDGLPAPEPGPVPAQLHWRLNDLPGALGAARSSGRYVFVDFTGYTCTNCRWMERNMFTRPEVKTALNRYVLARLFTDGDGAIYDRQQALQQRQFGTIALPLYAILDGQGNTVATFAGLTRSPREFLAFLDRARGD